MAADAPNAGPAEPAEPAADAKAAKAEPRTTEQIRREISEERDKLTRSLSDLRAGVHDARRIPMIVGGALVAGVAAVVAVKAVRGRGD